MRTALIFVLPLFVLLACSPRDPNKQVDEGSVKGETYESKEIGWSIAIPKGWTVVTRDKVDANDRKGKEAIESALGQQVDTKGLKHLISFQKDQFNVFNSTSEPFKEEYPGQYAENNRALNAIIYQTYASKGMQTDTSTSVERIQGLDFNTFHATIYGPDGKVLLYQTLYCRLINGYDFGVSINYNNEKDKQEMLSAFQASKFSR